MTTHDESPQGNEQDFQRDLAVLAERYRAAPGDGPPPELDAAIRAAARAAVTPPRNRIWWVPLSVAATVVLAVGVVVQMQRAPPQHGIEPAAIPAAAPTQSPAAPLAERAAEPGVLRQSATSPAETAAAAEMPESDTSAEASGAPALALPPAPAPAQPPTVKAERVADSAMNAQTAPPAAKVRAQAVSSAEQSVAAPAAAAPAAADAGLEPPERWLARIEALRRAGRAAEADAELARLREAYPGWLESRPQRQE